MATESKHRPRLLVVDDRMDNLIVLEQVIGEHLRNCEIATARSAEEGLAIIAAGRIDGALIDVQMPGIDGIEMCRRLKATPNTEGIPLMLITSHRADAATKARGLDAGADDFINRPIDNLELIARIRVMLRIKRAEDGLREINTHLEELVQVRTEKLRTAARRHAMLSRKVLLVQEDERARLSRELHDELGQILSALQYELGWLQRMIALKPESAAGSFGNATDMLDRAVTELRRICKALRPPLLDDLGVAPALRHLVDEFRKRNTVVSDIDIDLDDLGDEITPEAALCMYRVLQESLHNVTRHAEASAISVALTRGAHHLQLSVTDDGRGFSMDDPTAALGCGIDGMRERAHLVGGSLHIHSEPNRGTSVVLRVPLSELEGDACDVETSAGR